MKKVIFIACLAAFFFLLSSRGSSAQTYCSNLSKQWNAGSVFCPRGCQYTIQACITLSHGTITPSIHYNGLPCKQAHIQLVDDTYRVSRLSSTKSVSLRCDNFVSQTLYGSPIKGISLHKYKTVVITGPYGDVISSDACDSVTENDSFCVNEGEGPNVTVPLPPAINNRYYTPVNKVKGHGNYR